MDFQINYPENQWSCQDTIHLILKIQLKNNLLLFNPENLSPNLDNQAVICVGCKVADEAMNQNSLKDYYGLLEIPTSSGISDIHKAYWRKASQYHPDKGGTHEKMIQIAEAWKMLSDPAKRARYDQIRRYQQDGWHSRKFDQDVQEARKNAETYARSWTDFEEIYQKAFYTFNQDFYGKNWSFRPSDPYSPLLNSKSENDEADNAPKQKVAAYPPKNWEDMMIKYLFKTIVILMAFLFAFVWHRNNSGIGRYVPLHEYNQEILILDTSSGAVYSLEKQSGASAEWKKKANPFP